MKVRTVFTAAFLALMLLAPMVRAQSEPTGSNANTPAAAATSQPANPMAVLRNLKVLSARIAACKGKSADDPCSFSSGPKGSEKKVEGKCEKRQNGPLTCKPQAG
jgi:hypothetical protein